MAEEITINIALSSAKQERQVLARLLYEMYKIQALSRFEYTGFDKLGIDSAWIEERLFERDGGVGVVDDPRLGIIALSAATTGLKYNGTSYSWRLTGDTTGVVSLKNYTDADSALFINNRLRKGNYPLVWYWCTKMADIELTKAIERNKCKLGLMFRGTRNAMLSLKNKAKQILDCEPVTFEDNALSETSSLEVGSKGVQLVLDDLNNDYNVYEHRILTYLGIDNVDVVKRERLISGEAEQNNASINANLKNALYYRQRACEKVNELFNANVSVKIASDISGGIEDNDPAIEGDNDNELQV